MTVKFLKENRLIIYEVDKKVNDVRLVKGVYILPKEYMLGGHGCSNYLDNGVKISGKHIYSHVKEEVNNIHYHYYELREFITKLSLGNLEAIELLFAGPFAGYTPIDESIWSMLYSERTRFLTNNLKYSIGYLGLRILNYVKKEVNYLDYYIYMPGAYENKAEPLSRYNVNLVTLNKIDPDYVMLKKETGDLYRMYYSFRQAAIRGNSQQQPKSDLPGMKPENGIPPTCNLSERELTDKGLYPIGFVYFNSRGYSTAVNKNMKSYTNLERADAYKAVKTATDIGTTQNLRLPVTGLFLYQRLLSGVELRKDDIDILTIGLERAFQHSKLSNSIDNEVLNKIEARMRLRFELVNTIESET